MSIEIIDTHCHIHEAELSVELPGGVQERWRKLGLSPEDIIEQSKDAGVTRMICVGTTLADSKQAVNFARRHKNVWASIGLHPHEAKHYTGDAAKLDEFTALANDPKVVAVGECGLDYFYNNSPKKDQEEILRFQIELALANDLPMIFHVREAFDDFWPIFDSYKKIKGVIHSFMADSHELDRVLRRDLYVGLNGIVTFTKNQDEIAAIKSVPLASLLLETDAPYLTPAPYRDKICMPKHVRLTAEFLSDLRDESLEEIGITTAENALFLFKVR